MSSTQKEFYTAGELACLFEIPKQTLLYYDKTGLLVPEFISTNNYRYYSLKQYLILEIIINLRKLGIPVPVIKDYIKNRSEESFQKLLIEKEQECKNIIQYNQKIMNNIEVSLSQLQKLKDTHLNQININYRHCKHFLCCKDVADAEGDCCGRGHIKVVCARHAAACNAVDEGHAAC